LVKTPAQAKSIELVRATLGKEMWAIDFKPHFWPTTLWSNLCSF